MGTRRREKAKGQGRFERKDYVTIGFSVAAFALSIISFYYTALRVTDDIRVVAGEIPIAEPNFELKHFEVRMETSRYLFINAGNRSAVINGITLKFVQPQKGKDFPAAGCEDERGDIAQFDVASFILKPGDMVWKNATLIPLGANAQGKELRFAFSELNEKAAKVKFRMCVDVSFATPSIELALKTVNEFEDELDEDVLGYLFVRGKFVERRPVQLIKKNTALFLD